MNPKMPFIAAVIALVVPCLTLAADEEAGNNLSYPVIWSEDYALLVPECEEEAGFSLAGEWWYQWGINGSMETGDLAPASCLPNPDNTLLCLDGTDPIFAYAEFPLPLTKAFIQKDPANCWQATSIMAGEDPELTKLAVDFIDWGDNLESVDWDSNSMIRTEVVLFQDLTTLAPEADEFEMRHLSGLGIDEVHGVATFIPTEEEGLQPQPGPGTQGTVYSHCARLTIQRLLVDRDDPSLADLIWIAGEGWTEPTGYPEDLIGDHVFNGSVHEGGDGPGFYSAEINVKGRVIYGYTWNVRHTYPNPDDIPGDYRLTFSFDQTCGTVALNTYFIDGVTTILQPLEEESLIASLLEGNSDPGGGTAVLVPAKFDDLGELIGGNLTYMDITVEETQAGGNGGGGGGGNGGKPED